MPTKTTKDGKPSQLFRYQEYLDDLRPAQKSDALSRVEIPADVKLTNKGDRPVVKIPGRAVEKYAQLCEILADAKEAQAEQRDRLIKPGIEEVFNYNTHNVDTVSSAELVDATGARLLVTVRDAYSPLTDAAVDRLTTLAENAELTINDLVVEQLIGKFDSSVFLEVDGKFSLKRFNAFKKAIDEVAVKLQCESPLTYTKVITAKSDFHQQRWTRFPNVASQKLLQEVIPATVAAKPL